VVSARQWNKGRFMSAIFEYDGYHATFEMGVDQQRRFDAHIEVFGDTKQFRVQYDTPYIRHLPTTFTLGETVGEAYVETVTRPTFKDPYTHELEYFHEMITTGGSPKTTPEDFAGDLDLFQEIMRVLSAEAA
jgi:predicted dehydrogenase